MARQTFNPAAVGPRELVRFDLSSGTDSPAAVSPATGEQAYPSSQARARDDGTLPQLLGPDGVTTLYQKRLDFLGRVVGTPITLTAVAVPASNTGGVLFVPDVGEVDFATQAELSGLDSRFRLRTDGIDGGSP